MKHALRHLLIEPWLVGPISQGLIRSMIIMDFFAEIRCLNLEFKHTFFTCIKNSAVATCAKLWPDLIFLSGKSKAFLRFAEIRPCNSSWWLTLLNAMVENTYLPFEIVFRRNCATKIHQIYFDTYSFLRRYCTNVMLYDSVQFPWHNLMHWCRDPGNETWVDKVSACIIAKVILPCAGLPGQMVYVAMRWTSRTGLCRYFSHMEIKCQGCDTLLDIKKHIIKAYIDPIINRMAWQWVETLLEIICNIKCRLDCRYSPQNIFSANNFNPHKSRSLC